MKNVLLACKTMQMEIEWVLRHHPCSYERICWIKSGLHNVTETLKRTLQEELSAITDADRVVMGFGACGNALVGLTAGNFEMILPRVDDCISIMLGSYRRKRSICNNGETYFVTQGWMHGESNIYSEYQFTVEKYGKEMADMIYDEILGSYKNLGVIDTKACDYGKLLKETKIMSKELHLNQLAISGDLSYLERLLAGPWEETEFAHIRPHENITMDIF